MYHSNRMTGETMDYFIITIISTRTHPLSAEVLSCVCLLCLKCQRVKYMMHVPRAPCVANRVNRPNERRKKAKKNIITQRLFIAAA